MKRSFDIVVSLFALLLLLPVGLVVAIWIKLDSKGPVLFQQERVGRYGKPFKILKFRSMSVIQDAEAPLVTGDNDKRITRSGQILRKAKLDELPQLINVLKGDMSLVGPRPEVHKYVAMYSPSDKALILSVRPGITDNASIAFRNESEILAKSQDQEATYINEILPVKLTYYRAYVDHQTAKGDIAILIRTAAAITNGCHNKKK